LGKILRVSLEAGHLFVWERPQLIASKGKTQWHQLKVAVAVQGFVQGFVQGQIRDVYQSGKVKKGFQIALITQLQQVIVQGRVA
jgi:hypothetical protein